MEGTIILIPWHVECMMCRESVHVCVCVDGCDDEQEEEEVLERGDGDRG